MTKIVLVRHGHVEGISPERFRGRRDVPLTQQGEAQAAATARRIAAQFAPAALYTSPLARCVATGHAIAQACGVPTTSLAALADLDYGAWQWKTHEEIGTAFPDAYALWTKAPHLIRFPGGESLQDLVARAADALRLAIERHPADTAVLVGHESVNRAMLLQVLDQPLSAYWRLSQSPCAINEIDIDGGSARVIRINDTSHLERL